METRGVERISDTWWVSSVCFLVATHAVSVLEYRAVKAICSSHLVLAIGRSNLARFLVESPSGFSTIGAVRSVPLLRPDVK